MKEVINNQMEQYIDYLQNSKVTVEEQIPEKNHEETNNSTGYINYEQYNQMSCDISEVTCTNDSTYNDVVHDKSRPSSSIGRHSSHSGRSHEHSRHSSRSRGEKNHKHRYDGDRKRKHSCERHVYRDRGRTHSEDYKEERLHPYKDKERDRVYLHHDDRNKKYVSPDDEQYRKHSHPENDRSRRDPHSDNGKNKRYLHLRTDRDRSFHGEYDRDRFVHKQHQRKRSPPIHRNGEDRHDYKHSYRPEKRH
ncbi:unnamed protein product [Acanthoscelides obtectus]|uniref:Uncharacterized protein n=1 Tax=Acanthoscelides obtectus TaxID=200917 RepID=A0A9P0LAU4_ACAOB|nr:unnamed protein product [Acanthoscelides obtectus]CAK1649855.1 hypothetical protein AOBTE_LOCUS16460 [Acanthoscelides obtectus]